jgi:hypothetical protein
MDDLSRCLSISEIATLLTPTRYNSPRSLSA